MRPHEILSAAALLGGLFFIGYLVPRHETLPLIAAWGVAFTGYLGLLRCGWRSNRLQVFLGIAVAARFLLLFPLPSLSDDYFRFLWDGNLIIRGINPFADTPKALAEQGLQMPAGLLEGMNSPEYNTIYPPVAQAVYALAALLSFGNTWTGVLIMRLVLFAGELLTLRLLPRALEEWGSDRRYALLYALNPLVILEIVGNLHFEGLMITALLAFLIAWKRGRFGHAAFFLAVAVAVKLLPLILMPLLIRRIGVKRFFIFGLQFTGWTLLFFAPLLGSAFFTGFSGSFALYFQKFEFNASIYTIVREIGKARTGYNIIADAGKWMAGLTFASIILYVLLERARQVRLPVAATAAWSLYLLFALTIHPWYAVPLLFFGVFRGLCFPVVWTAMIFLTYGGYTDSGYEESLTLIAVEYGAVLLAAGVDVWRLTAKKNAGANKSAPAPV